MKGRRFQDVSFRNPTMRSSIKEHIKKYHSFSKDVPMKFFHPFFPFFLVLKLRELQ